MADLPENLDRYRRQSPYEILGVAPDATAKEINDRHNTLQHDLRESGVNSSERTKEMNRLSNAYKLVCKPGERLRVDFFLLDSKLGIKQCEAIVRQLPKPSADIKGFIKPRKIRVTHAALHDELLAFHRDPARVTGFHAQPMEIAETSSLPEALAIHFDC